MPRKLARLTPGHGILAAAFTLSLCLQAHGQTNTFFGASQNISGTSDVFKAGASIWALNDSNSSATVNEQLFGTGNVAGTTGGGPNAGAFWNTTSPANIDNFRMRFQNATGNLQDIQANSGSASGTFSNLDPGYRQMLNNAILAGNTGTVTLNGLTSGRAYVLQAWANGSEGTAQNNTNWHLVGGANDNTNANRTSLAVNTTGAVGGTGQHFLLAFQAGGSTAQFAVSCQNAIRLNAMQVRDVTGYWLGNLSNAWSSTANNFMGGMNFANSQITSGGFVAFTDLNLFTGTEANGLNNTRTVSVNRDISIQGTGVSIGQVRFENNTETYTFSNASGTTGITGATSLLQTGTGTVVLNSANTYTGTTTVNAGTLRVNGTTGTGAVTIASGARLQGNGSILGAATINGTHAPGNNGIGTQTIQNGIAYAAGSVFEWELTGNTNTGRGTSWDGVNLNGGEMSVASNAIFRLVLNNVDFTDGFWNQDRTWNVFSTSGDGTIASVFQNFEITGGQNYNTDLGTFSMTSSGTLQWTAIPEPSTALAGLLLAAGIMRRRRPA